MTSLTVGLFYYFARYPRFFCLTQSRQGANEAVGWHPSLGFFVSRKVAKALRGYRLVS